MTLDDLEAALDEVLPPGFRFEVDDDGQIVICTNLTEDDDGELVGMDHDDDELDFDSDDDESEEDDDD